MSDVRQCFYILLVFTRVCAHALGMINIFLYCFHESLEGIFFHICGSLSTLHSFSSTFSPRVWLFKTMTNTSREASPRDVIATG